MYRIKDPKPTLEFYTGVLGMTLLNKLDFPGQCCLFSALSSDQH